MKKHILLTGEIQVGKSTALAGFLEKTGVRADGFVTRFLHTESGRELYISRFDSVTGECMRTLAVRMNKSQPEVFADAFSVSGVEILHSAGCYGLIIMDELGVFEERSPEFKQAVFERLDGDIQILGVVKKKISPFLDAVRLHPKVAVIEVTEKNRDSVPDMIKSVIDNI